MCSHIQCGHSEPPPFWLGDPGPCQGTVSGTGSPHFLALHQSLSESSSPLPVSKRQSWENILTGTEPQPAHVSPSPTWMVYKEGEVGAGQKAQFLLSLPRKMVPMLKEEGHVPPVFPLCAMNAAMPSMKSFLEETHFFHNKQMPHRFGASFVNDF